VEFRPPPAWLMRYGNPGPFIRPEMRQGLVCLLLPHVGYGGPTVWDISRYGNHGTYYDGTSAVMSELGPVMNLPGTNDDIQVADANSLDVTDAVTVFIIVKANSDPRNFNGVMINKANSTGADRPWTFYSRGTSDEIHINSYEADATSHTAHFSMPAEYYELNWCSMTLLKNNAGLYSFFNGKEMNSDVGAYTMVTNAEPIFMGHEGGNALDYKGKLALVAIWNRGLAPAAILSLARDFWGTMFWEPKRYWFVSAAAGWPIFGAPEMSTIFGGQVVR